MEEAWQPVWWSACGHSWWVERHQAPDPVASQAPLGHPTVQHQAWFGHPMPSQAQQPPPVPSVASKVETGRVQPEQGTVASDQDGVDSDQDDWLQELVRNFLCS
jgi:hypothetical protein